MNSMVSAPKPVDENRLALAAERLSMYADLKEKRNWLHVWQKLEEYGWHMEKTILASLVGAPAEWLREIGHLPPEDVIVNLSEAGLGLEVAYGDGTVRRIAPEEMPLLALVVEAIRLWPGSTLATEAKEIGRKRYPKRKGNA